MISHFTVRLRKLRRWASRSYWAIRLLHLSKSEGTSTQPGLVLIQIDGLSLKQFQRGIKENNLPFLKQLIQKQKYKQYTHYSGLPSTTPAVQGELFYGVKGCVPAFHFVDHETCETFVMFEPKSASQIENRITKIGGPALLKEGSSYSNIFTGGARESHFCAASIRWSGFFKLLNPFTWFLLIIFHLNILIRMLVLLTVELISAFIESVRGTLAGERLTAELMFILARVFICVLLRELVVMGAKIDIARGLPIIHLNFFGYDEQSHRRGPSSKFAHWSLKGIDDGVSRIWNEAQQADRRDYDIWIYSDHGQEDTLPYSVEHKKEIKDVVSHIFGEAVDFDAKRSSREIASCCGAGNYSKAIFPFPHVTRIEKENPKVTITGMGPIGHIYPALELTAEERERVISELLNTAKVPLVLIQSEKGRIEARIPDGKYFLPEDAGKILGDDHPFLSEATEDLIRLCQHPSAGKIIFCGWRKGERPRTYPLENGSHCSFGPEETNGFALLPSDALVAFNDHPYLRPIQLREAALRHLGKMPIVTLPYSEPAEPAKTLRLMTYNVHGCVGLDGKLSPDRIARVIARHNLDAVALQELDVGRNRSGGIDQAEMIARKLNMSFQFHPSFHLKEGQYGNAILSRFPMKIIRMDSLPRLKAQRVFEPRGALWVELNMNGTKINLVTSHLSLWPAERLLQAEALLGSDWIGSAACEGPIIICGDFNAQPNSIVCKRIGCKLRDAQMILKSHRPYNTWIRGRLDHIFVSPDIEVMNVAVPGTELDKISSDHLPLIVELKFNECGT